MYYHSAFNSYQIKYVHMRIVLITLQNRNKNRLVLIIYKIFTSSLYMSWSHSLFLPLRNRSLKISKNPGSIPLCYAISNCMLLCRLWYPWRTWWTRVALVVVIVWDTWKMRKPKWGPWSRRWCRNLRKRRTLTRRWRGKGRRRWRW